MIISQTPLRVSFFGGGTDLPAPAAQVWAKVAVLLATGLDSIPQSAQLAMLIAGSVGIAIALLEHFVPSSRRFLPSVMGLGIACTVPFSNTFSMFLGSVIAVVVAKAAPVFNERFTVIIASGLIAGETLAAVAVIAYQLL